MSRRVDVIALRTLSPRDRRAVLLGLVVLLPALLYTAAVRPYRAALEDVRARAAAERGLLERELAIMASAQTTPDGFEAVQARADRAALRLIAAPSVPLAEAQVTGFLEELALLSRVLLQEMRGVEPRRGEALSGPLRPIRLSIRGESDLEGVMTFLQRIEESPLLMRVSELSLEPQFEGTDRGGDRRATGVVSISMIMEAFAPSDLDGETSSGQEASP